MEGMKGLTEKKYKELILFSNEGTKMGRDREYIEILRNLDRKRYWGRKNIEKYYLILLKKI